MSAKNETWRTKMKKQRELKAQGARLTFQRVILLKEVYESEDFQAWCSDNGVEAYDELDEELGDIGQSYLTMIRLLEVYPTEIEWSKRRLDVMIAEVKEKRRSESSSEKPAWKAKALEARKEIERLERELEKAHARIEELERVIRMLSSGSREPVTA